MPLAMSHTLSLLQTCPYLGGAFVCNLCWEEGCGPVYHCSDCNFDVHIKCAATEAKQTHFTHYHHPLHLRHCGGNSARKCDSCGSIIRTWSFRCELCNFEIHSMCARAPRCIKNPHHLHPLALSKSDDLRGLSRCNGCEMLVTDFFYRCHSCQYNLHQVCATLPRKIKHVKHHHVLTFIYYPPLLPLEVLLPMCNECKKVITGWRYLCGICNYYLHPGCTKLVHELPHFNMEVNPSPGRTNSTTLETGSMAHRVSHAPAMPSTSHNATMSATAPLARRPHAPMPLSSNNAILSATASLVHRALHASMSAMASIAHRVSPALMPSTSHNASHPCAPNDKDWEAVERVLQFARDMAKGSVVRAAEGTSSNQLDEVHEHCPTCLEGFDSTNPKKLTSCGHYFHMACILEWMEKSTCCPICRKHLNILM